LSVEAQHQQPTSTLALYQRLLSCRRTSKALQLGDWQELPSHPQVLAYRREHEDDERLVCINFSEASQVVSLAVPWTLQVASDGQGEGRPFTGWLAAEQAVILCRRTA
jgi:alpha-glucosidase